MRMKSSHPALIRTLIRELRTIKIPKLLRPHILRSYNELNMIEILDISAET